MELNWIGFLAANKPRLLALSYKPDLVSVLPIHTILSGGEAAEQPLLVHDLSGSQCYR